MPAWTRTSKKETEERAALVQKEIAKRRGQSATYTQHFLRCNGSSSSSSNSPVSVTAAAAATTTMEEYDQDVQSFLTEFYGRGIFERSADMTQLLQQYPDTLAVHYALLVPSTVSFDQFWSRYYYKCSATTILREWSQRDADAARVKTSTVQHVLPTLQQQLMNREIERGDLGSRPTTALVVVESSSSSSPPSPHDSKDPPPKSTSTSTSSSNSSNRTLWEERMAARAQSLYEEAFSDIVETIPEESIDHGDQDHYDETDHDDAVAIGFAASG
jgi:BSD domain